MTKLKEEIAHLKAAYASLNQQFIHATQQAHPRAHTDHPVVREEPHLGSVIGTPPGSVGRPASRSRETIFQTIPTSPINTADLHDIVCAKNP